MPIAEAQLYAELEQANKRDSKMLCRTVASEPKIVRPYARPHLSEVAAPSDFSSSNMMDEAGAIRRDVERVLALFLSAEPQALRSPAGRIAIDESRVDKRSSPRKELYATRPHPIVHNDRGERLVRVNHGGQETIKSKHRAPSGTNELSELRLWCLTVAAMLGRLQREHQDVLLVAARHRKELHELRTYVRFADTTLGSVSKRKRLSRKQAQEMKSQREASSRRKDELSKQLIAIVRTKAYREGCAFFELQSSLAGDDVRRYVFRERE